MVAFGSRFPELGVRAVVKDIGKFMSDLGRMDSAVQATGRSLGTRAQAIGAGMSNIGGSLTKFVTLPVVGMGFLALKSAISFESAFAGVRKTIDATEPEFAVLRQGIRDMAKEVPASVQEISKVAEAAGALGIAKAYILDFSRTMIDMGETTDLTADEAAMNMARIANIMQTPQDQFDNMGSAIVDLGNKGASTEREIVEMALRIAGAGKMAGLTEGSVVGLASGLASVGIEAEMGGSAISRVIFEMTKSFAAGDERMALFAATARMSVGEFAELFERDAAEALIRFIEGLGGVVDSGGNAIGVMEDLELSGIRVEDMLLRSAGAGQLLRDQVQIGNKAWQENTALTTEAEKRYATTAAQLEILRNKVVDAAISLGDALLPALKDAVKLIEAAVKVFAVIVKAFAALPKPLRMVIIGFFLLGAAIGPVMMGLGPLISMFGMLMLVMANPAAMLMMATTIASVSGVLIAIAPYVIALIAVLMILYATAPLIQAAWGPVTDFFQKSVPAAFSAVGQAVADAVKGIWNFVKGLAGQAARAGAELIMGVARGVAAAASSLYRVVAAIVSNIIEAFNIWKWVFGSSITDVYGKAGKQSGLAFMGGLAGGASKGLPKAQAALTPDRVLAGQRPARPDARLRTAFAKETGAALAGDLEEGLEDGLEGDLEEGLEDAIDGAGEGAADAATGAGASAGNAFLAGLEAIVSAGLGAAGVLAAPLDALRGVISSLGDEMSRLAGLPTIESAAERLQKAQLQIQLLALKPGERKARRSRERINAIDEEIDGLVEQRTKLIELAQAHTKESDAVDDRIRGLAGEKKGLEDELSAYEEQRAAIEDQIDALDMLAQKRDAEREMLVARAAMSDRTLATDAAVLAQMERMQPVIADVTAKINEQADSLWLKFIPAWQDAQAAAAGGAGAGAGVEAPGMEGLEGLEGMEGFDAAAMNAEIDKAIADMPNPAEAIESWINKYRPALAAVGVTMLAIVLFGWNVGLVVAVGAAIGLLIYTFRDEIAKGFEAVAGFLKGHWKEVLSVLTLPVLGPVVALATDAFGIRSGLTKGLKAVLGFVTGWAKKLVDKVSKLPDYLKKHWERIVQVALLVLFPPAGGLFAIITNFDKIKAAVVRIVTEMASKLAGLFRGLVATVSGAVGGLVTEVVGFFSSLATTVVGLVSSLVNSVVGFFTALPGRIVSALSGLVGAIGGIASSAISGFLSWFEGIPGAIAGFFGGIPGAIAEALGDLGGWLWDHIAQPIIDLLSDIANFELFGVSLEDLVDFFGGIFNVGAKLLGLSGGTPEVQKAGEPAIVHTRQLGWWSVPGTGNRDTVAALLTPGEMVVPAGIAGLLRAGNRSFSDLLAPAQVPMMSRVMVSAPITVTIHGQSWAEIRRVVHQEVDTALAGARAQTEMAGSELSGEIG